ncbi:MAG: CHAT domain-containing protein [Arcticibacter sp.]
MEIIKTIKTILIFLAICTTAQAQNGNFEELKKQFQTEIGEKDYLKALATIENIVKIAKEKFGENDTVYAFFVSKNASLYRLMGKPNKALPLYEEALEVYKIAFKDHHPDVAILMNNLAGVYSDLGQQEKARMLYEKALYLNKIIGGDVNINVAINHNNLANIYSELGQFEKALNNYKAALDMKLKLLGNEDPSVALSLNNLATAYSDLGQNDKALPLHIVALRIRKSVYGNDHPSVAESLNNLAAVYFDMGYFEKALTLFEDALGIYKKAYGNEHIEVAVSLNNLANAYSELGQRSEAIQCYEKSLKIRKHVLGNENPKIAIALNNLANLYSYQCQYEKAISYYDEALSIHKNNLNHQDPRLALIINNKASTYYLWGKHNNSVKLFENSLNIYKLTWGNKSPKTALTQSNLAFVHYILKNYNQAFDYYLEWIEITENKITAELKVIPESINVDFIKKNTRGFDKYDSFFFENGNEFPKSKTQALNNSIFLNGIAMRSGQQLRRSILESGDSVLIEQYEDWIVLKRRLIKADELTIEERNKKGIDTDSIQDRIESLERNLAARSKDFASIKEKDQLDYLKVKQALKPNEAYVLFNSFPYFKNGSWTDSVLYGAYVIRHNQQEPQWIYLFEQRTLDSLLAGSNPEETVNYIYTSADLYRAIWRPLELALQGAEQVTFSPAGSLHRVAFHAITDSTGHTLSQRYQLKQVSGATQVVYPANPILFEENSTSNAIALFGGINYQSTSTEMQQALQGLNIDTSLAFATRSLLHNEDQRGLTWNYLPGTKTEVTRIEGLFKSKGKNTMLYQDNLGLEDRLKRLESKQAPHVLHLATHGFYLPDPKQNRNLNMFQTLGEENRFSRADNPLLRSGLLFAGASRTWKGEPTEPGAEDGILTAMEVANLDLRNTRMVVLSACQTALGDIKGKEGVFGLQRGFKLAGVDYIVMSLWPVPDKETSEFMELFYTNLLESNNIPQAFNQTRASMQNKYPNEPYKWAGMVLVE